MQAPQDVENTEVSDREVGSALSDAEPSTRNSSIPLDAGTPTQALPRVRQDNAPVTFTPQHSDVGAHMGQLRPHYDMIGQRPPMYPYPMGPNLDPHWGSLGNYAVSQHQQQYMHGKPLELGPYAGVPLYVQPPSSFPYDVHAKFPWNTPWQVPLNTQHAWPVQTRQETTHGTVAVRKERKKKSPKPEVIPMTPMTPQRDPSYAPAEGNEASHAHGDEDRPNPARPANNNEQSHESSNTNPPPANSQNDML